MVLSYEAARSLRFKIWLFLTTNILLILAGVYISFLHVTGKMAAQDQTIFYDYLSSFAKQFLPAMLGGAAAKRDLAAFASVPDIDRFCVSNFLIVFKWTPIGVVVGNAATWVVGLVAAGWWRQVKQKK